MSNASRSRQSRPPFQITLLDVGYPDHHGTLGSARDASRAAPTPRLFASEEGGTPHASGMGVQSIAHALWSLLDEELSSEYPRLGAILQDEFVDYRRNLAHRGTPHRPRGLRGISLS